MVADFGYLSSVSPSKAQHPVLAHASVQWELNHGLVKTQYQGPAFKQPGESSVVQTVVPAGMEWRIPYFQVNNSGQSVGCVPLEQGHITGER